MTSAQKLLVWDYLRRWRWGLIFGAAMHLGFMIAAGWLGAYVISGILCSSAIGLYSEFRPGRGKYVRALLSLPVTPGELGRCWRLVGFTLPATAGFAILVVGKLIGIALGAPPISGESFLIAALSQSLILGAIFYILVGVKVSSQVVFGWRQYPNVVAGFLFALLLPVLLIFVAMPLPGSWEEMGSIGAILGVVFALATGLGWFHSRSAPLRWLERPGAHVQRRVLGKCATTAWHGFGGLRYLLLQSARQLAPIFAMWIAMGWAIGKFLGNGSHRHFAIAMFIFISVYLSLKPLVSQLRTLRTLPLSRGAICHLLVFWPWLLSLIFLSSPGWIAFAWFGNPDHWLRWEIALLAAVSGTLFVPMVLRFGLDSWAILALVPFVMGALGAGPISEYHPDWRLILIVGAAVLTLVWRLTYGLLDSSYPWRDRDMPGGPKARGAAG